MRYTIRRDPRILIPEIDKLVLTPAAVSLAGDFCEESAAAFKRNLAVAEARALETGQTILPIEIDSYGGEIYSLMACVDAIRAVDKSITIATILNGKAMSAGAILFTCGHPGFRYMAPNSTLMFHPASAGTQGTVDDMEISVEEARRLNEAIMKIAAKNVGKPESFFTKLLKDKNNSDLYMTAEQAIAHGIANKIGIPKFTLDVKYEIGFDETATIVPEKKKVNSKVKKVDDTIVVALETPKKPKKAPAKKK